MNKIIQLTILTFYLFLGFINTKTINEIKDCLDVAVDSCD